MSMYDPISDMLTRIRNAANAEHEKADVPSSRLKQEIVKILKDEGYVKNYRLLEDQKRPFIRVYFKRTEGEQNRRTHHRPVSAAARRRRAPPARRPGRPGSPWRSPARAHPAR